MSSASLRWAAATALVLACAVRSDAAGFAMFEQGARGMGFAGAFTAQASDPSAIFHNAAGIAFLRGTQLYFGGTLVAPGADFEGANPFPGAGVTEKGDVGLLIPPNAYYTQAISARLVARRRPARTVRAGDRLGEPGLLHGPLHLPVAKLTGFALNPTIAFKLEDRLSVGVGLDVRFSSVSLERRVPIVNPFTQRVVDAAVTLESDTSTGFGFNVGVLAKPSESLSVGALLSSQGEGRLRAAPPPSSRSRPATRTSTRACARRCRRAPCRSPPRSRSPRWRPAASPRCWNKWTFEVDVNWYQWITFDSLRLDVRDGARDLTRRSTRSTRTPSSTASAWSASSPTAWTVRGGYFYDETPAPPASISPLLPDSTATASPWAAPTRRASSASTRPPGTCARRALDRRTEPRPLRRHLQEQCAHAGRLARLHVLAEGETDAKHLCPRRRRARLLRGTARRPDGPARVHRLLLDRRQPGRRVRVRVARTDASGGVGAGAHRATGGCPDFQLPLVSEPGIPIELHLATLSPAPLIVPKSDKPGAPTNLALTRAYNNLAVPGATVLDAGTRTTDNGGLHDLILRGRGTQVAQAVAARPSVITLWIGNNDVLGGVGPRPRDRRRDGDAGRRLPRPTTPVIVATLRNTGARIVAANLPDVTSHPVRHHHRAGGREPDHRPAGADQRPARPAASGRRDRCPPAPW